MALKKSKSSEFSLEQKSWYQDRYLISVMQRNFLILVCLFVLIALVSSLVTIKSMVERHSVEPYIFKVSEKDGIPVALKTDSVKQYSKANQPVIEYFLARYVEARESYNSKLYTYNYHTIVKSMSTLKIYKKFYTVKIRDQENSPISRLGESGEAKVTIKEITSNPSKNISTFRISLETLRRGVKQGIQNYQIVLHYELFPEQLTYKDITINPLGIKIDAYDVFEEKAISN